MLAPLVIVGGAAALWYLMRNDSPSSEALAPIGGGLLLRRDAANAFTTMRAKAAADGVELYVNSAYRTFAEQTRMYGLYLSGQGNLAAKPGTSRHESGLAVDIETEGGTNAAFQWLNANATAFGFRRTVASEPWHWEFLS